MKTPIVIHGNEIPPLTKLGFCLFPIKCQENHPFTQNYFYGNTPPATALIKTLENTKKEERVENGIYQHQIDRNLYIVFSEGNPYMVLTRGEDLEILLSEKILARLIGKNEPVFEDFLEIIKIRIRNIVS